MYRPGRAHWSQSFRAAAASAPGPACRRGRAAPEPSARTGRGGGDKAGRGEFVGDLADVCIDAMDGAGQHHRRRHVTARWLRQVAIELAALGRADLDGRARHHRFLLVGCLEPTPAGHNAAEHPCARHLPWRLPTAHPPGRRSHPGCWPNSFSVRSWPARRTAPVVLGSQRQRGHARQPTRPTTSSASRATIPSGYG